MKNYFIRFRPFLLFLGKFFLAYGFLTVLYYLYLNLYDDKVDGITTHVAFLTEKIAQFFGLNLSVANDVTQFKVFYENKYTIRIIEGCNAVSLIILFVSFVFSFAGRFKASLLYMLLGSMLIYGINILRIIVFVVLLYSYPDFEHVIHGVVFPAIIYGLVFMLCIIWVNKYSVYA